MQALLAELSRKLEETGHPPLSRAELESVRGGCIHETYRIRSREPDRSYFLKVHGQAHLRLFEAEAAGLEEILDAKAIRAPRPILTGTAGSRAFLLLEYLDLRSGRLPASVQETFGRQLATLHRVHGPKFGWHRDNVIGETPQRNPPEPDWISFFREHRLRFQMELAEKNGLSLPKSDRLLDGLPGFFENHVPEPSLLHGDLWCGNVGWDQDGQPVIYDPAVYYGDRETDLAFTEMFGGFDPAFYRAYDAAYPLETGYQGRKELYNLYHLLNHYNLFGGHYGSSAAATVGRLVTRLR